MNNEWNNEHKSQTTPQLIAVIGGLFGVVVMGRLFPGAMAIAIATGSNVLAFTMVPANIIIPGLAYPMPAIEGLRDAFHHHKLSFEYVPGLVERLVVIFAIGLSLFIFSTGLKDLDEITLGWQPSDLIILAARPSMGKTALMLECARSAAVHSVQEGVISLEMSAEALTQRVLTQVSNVGGDLVCRIRLTPDKKNCLFFSVFLRYTIYIQFKYYFKLFFTRLIHLYQ